MTTEIRQRIGKIEALTKFLECDIKEVIAPKYDSNIFFNLKEDADYLVLTEDQAIQQSCEYIEHNLWAFNVSFLIRFISSTAGLNYSEISKFKKAITEMQESMCDSCNEIIKSLVGKRLNDLINSALKDVGCGHFLSSYDGKENQAGEFFIYRTN